MNEDQIRELRGRLRERGPIYLDGYTAAMHALSAELREDAAILGPDPGRANAALAEYLIVRAQELSRDAEALRQ